MVRKIAVALTAGGAAYGITELTNQPRIWSLTLSVFISGVLFVVQVLVDFEGRLAHVETTSEQHQAVIEETVKTGFAKVNETTELLSLVEASALRTDTVTQLLRHSARIDPTTPPLRLSPTRRPLPRA